MQAASGGDFSPKIWPFIEKSRDRGRRLPPAAIFHQKWWKGQQKWVLSRQKLPKWMEGSSKIEFQGGAPQANWPKVMEGCSKIEVSELSRGSRGSRLSRGSGGSKHAPDPTFHTRRGPGWRELTQTPSIYYVCVCPCCFPFFISVFLCISICSLSCFCSFCFSFFVLLT